MPAQLSKNWFQSLRDMFIGQPPSVAADSGESNLLPIQPHTPFTDAGIVYGMHRIAQDYKQGSTKAGLTADDVTANQSALLPLLYQALAQQAGPPRTVARSNGFGPQFASLLGQTTVPQSAINSTRFLLHSDRPIDPKAIAQFFPDRGTGEDTVAVGDLNGMDPSTLAHEMQHKFNMRAFGMFPTAEQRTKLAAGETALNEFLAALTERKHIGWAY